MVNGQEAISRRTLIGGMGGAFAALLATPKHVLAAPGKNERVNDPFIVLLKGLYAPVLANQGPAGNLGLTSVDLSDGSYSRVPIHPVFGMDPSHNQDHPIGTFYVQFAGMMCAYDLPGGSIAMQFLNPPDGAPPGYNAFVAHDDGANGFFLEGTWELTIVEATGVYHPFEGGHNHMVDRLHQLADGMSYDEFCFCNISTYEFP
jgi:hypothetical protein